MTGNPALDALLAFFPVRWKPYLLLGLLAVVVVCKLITVLIAPPAPTSRWASIYAVVSKIALNIGFAVNAYQQGRTAVMVPTEARGDVRTAVAAKLDIPREATKP